MCASPSVDSFSRHHIHGLDWHFLSAHGLGNEYELVNCFHKWLSKYVNDVVAVYGHAPYKEQQLLSPLNVVDVCLKPWAERQHLYSHSVALSWKLNSIPVNGVTCSIAHCAFKGWRPKCVHSPSQSDVAKMNFFHHCSLYDSLECFLYHSLGN
jgi:hypothetical protein